MATKKEITKENTAAKTSQESQENTGVSQAEASVNKDLLVSKEDSNAAKSNPPSLEVRVPKKKDWVRVPQMFALSVFIEYDRSCRWYPRGLLEGSVQQMLSMITTPWEVVIYTDGSVRADRSAWAFTAEVGGWIVMEDAGALPAAFDSNTMEIMAVTKAMEWLTKWKYTRACILSDSLSMIEKIQYGWFRREWVELLGRSRNEAEKLEEKLGNNTIETGTLYWLLKMVTYRL